MHASPLVWLETVPLRYAKITSRFEPCLQQCVAARLTDFSHAHAQNGCAYSLSKDSGFVEFPGDVAHAYLRLHVVHTDRRIRQSEDGGQCRASALTTVSF